MRARSYESLAIAACVLLAGCGNPKLPGECTTGQTRTCICVTGDRGAQLCAGGVYGACTCGDFDAGPIQPRDAYVPPIDASHVENDAVVVARDASVVPVDAGAADDCISSCAGCCNGTTCIPAASESLTMCGLNGGLCRACTGSETCMSGMGCVTVVGHCSVAATTTHDPAFTDSCAGAQMCLCPPGADTCASTGVCQDALPRTFVIRIAEAIFPAHTPDGSCWDGPGCGMPDPYVQVNVDGMTLGMTMTASDVFDATWSPPTEFTTPLHDGSAIIAQIYDEDVLSDDLAFTCGLTWSASAARSRTFYCESAAGTLIGTITPGL